MDNQLCLTYRQIMKMHHFNIGLRAEQCSYIGILPLALNAIIAKMPHNCIKIRTTYKPSKSIKNGKSSKKSESARHG